jgi:hypothetical protein
MLDLSGKAASVVVFASGRSSKSLPKATWKSLALFLVRLGCRRMLHLAVTRRQPIPYLFRIVIEWAHSAAVSNPSLLINDVESLGPGRVGLVGAIVHVVDAKGHRVPEPFHKIISDGQALLQILGLGVADVVFQIGFHLPLIGGMGFADVDGQEIGVLLIIVIKVDDVAHLATKRRSSKAAEDQHQRATRGALAQMKSVVAVQCHQPRIGRIVAGL